MSEAAIPDSSQGEVRCWCQGCSPADASPPLALIKIDLLPRRCSSAIEVKLRPFLHHFLSFTRSEGKTFRDAQISKVVIKRYAAMIEQLVRLKGSSSECHLMNVGRVMV